MIDTFYRSTRKHRDPEVFFLEQRLIHKEFNQWLNHSEQSLPVILIYDTARDYDGTEPFGLLRAQGLPEPHILIYNNGLMVRINPKHVGVVQLQNVASDTETLSTRLKATLDGNNASISQELTPWEAGINQTVNTLVLGGKAIKTKSSFFCFEDPEVVEFFRYLRVACENEAYGKSFSAHNETPALYYYDRQVNGVDYGVATTDSALARGCPFIYSRR